MKCVKCQSENIISAIEYSSLLCGNCGYVIAEDFLKAENTFSEIGKVGNQYSGILGSASMSALQSSSSSSSSSHNMIMITKLFTMMSNQLNLPQSFIETAKRYYKCSVNKNYTKGRSLMKVACVIMYSLCRMNKTRHLLIDFSDIAKINLYQLGVAYLQFVKLFQLTIPMSDPSLFIKRFCSKLTIDHNGNNAHNDNGTDHIASIALKIVQCMKSQWITEGRHPCGICGAAIYIALKYNGYKANIEDIADIVRASAAVIKMRIEEFELTPYAKLTIEEFNKGEFALLDVMDPPSFSVNREKERIEEKCSNNDSKGEEDKDKDNGDLVTKASSSMNLYENAISSSIKSSNQYYGDGDDNGNCNGNDDEGEISDLNEDEKENYINTDKEYALRKVIWEEKNKEWLEEQKEKTEHYLNNKRQRVSPSSKALSNIKKTIPNYKTPSEAILTSRKFNKMGLSRAYINNLFD